jgi:selenoprotein W-related protein
MCEPRGDGLVFDPRVTVTILSEQTPAGSDPGTKRPRVEITYCTQCRWLLRAAWMAQELLTTFADELGEVALVPGSGGVFQVHVQGELIWSRAAQGRFPEIKELKQLVRDRVAPGKDLGHSDARTNDSSHYESSEHKP